MSIVKVKENLQCRVCGSAEMKRWVHLPQMPLTDDLRNEPAKNNVFLHDINVYICEKCDVSQTITQIDLGDYYLDYAYTVAGSNFANSFMDSLANAVYEKYQVPKDAIVIEVGSGDGKQLSYFKQKGAKVLGFEPSAVLCNRSEEIGVPVYQGLFTEESIKNVPQDFMNANVLLLTYTFDHIPTPIAFLEAAKKMIDPTNGLLIIEVHDLNKIVQRREYCLFEHEHFIYLTEETMKSVLNKTGFELLTTELLQESERRGNSLLIVAALRGSKYRSDNGNKVILPINYKDFNNEMALGIKRLDDFVESIVSQGKKIAGYGAGGRGVMTLAAMESASKLSYVCDSNINFQDKYTPKSSVLIKSPEYLQVEPVDVLLVFSFGYINEICENVTQMTNTPKQIISMLEVL
jgi:hypothetical protein